MYHYSHCFLLPCKMCFTWLTTFSMSTSQLLPHEHTYFWFSGRSCGKQCSVVLSYPCQETLLPKIQKLLSKPSVFYFVFKTAVLSHKHGLLSTSSIKVTTSYLNNVHILTTKSNQDWKDTLRFEKRETDSNQARTVKITNRWPSPTTLYLRVKGLIKKQSNR